MTVLVVAALGTVAGAVLPRLLAVIPDRDPLPGEQARRSYRELAEVPRLPGWLAVATAGSWVLLAAARGLRPDLPVYLLAGLLGVAMGYVDIREHRLPDWLTYPAFAGCATMLAVVAGLDDAWSAYGRSVLAAGALVLGYLALALVRPGELGLGDVKLAATVGLLLGWVGWGHVVVGTFLGFLAGGLVSVVLLVAGRAGRRSELPFGPFMMVGALAAVAWGDALVDAYLTL